VLAASGGHAPGEAAPVARAPSGRAAPAGPAEPAEPTRGVLARLVGAIRRLFSAAT